MDKIVLKIDQGARRDERRVELATILREAVWGESSTMHMTLKMLVGGLVRWHSSQGSADPINEAIATVVESASLGLIRKSGSYWKPGEAFQAK
jgi:hypothetical protein